VVDVVDVAIVVIIVVVVAAVVAVIELDKALSICQTQRPSPPWVLKEKKMPFFLV
jgi:hypothetical protein